MLPRALVEKIFRFFSANSNKNPQLYYLGTWLKEISVFSVQSPKNLKIELPQTPVEKNFRFFSKNSKKMQC